MAQAVGARGQFHYLVHRLEDDVVVDEAGTVEIATPSSNRSRIGGYATAAVEALVAKLREASEVHRFVAHTPLERPESGRVPTKTTVADVGALRLTTLFDACGAHKPAGAPGSALRWRAR